MSKQREDNIYENSNLPSINGLVLAGGQSSRMGEDKGLIKWHDKEQRYHVADLLSPFCDEVFISCREEQIPINNEAYAFLPDNFINIGPIGGVLSAFQFQKNKAWLVVACDMPLLDTKTIHYLITNRGNNTIATTYKNLQDGLPEPLIAIWEPSSYPILLSFLENGTSSLRKVLMNNPTTILKPMHPHVFMNVNTPKEVKKMTEIFSKFSSFKRSS